jgi:magnesium transporter
MADTTKMSTKTGLPPGTLVHIGEKRTGKVKVTAIRYNEDLYEEREIEEFRECPLRDDSTVAWLNIDGVHQLPLVEKVGSCFGLHPLTLEDIVNTSQFPKLEDYGDYVFIVLKMLYYDEKENEIEVEQVSLCLGSNFVVSFQEETGRDVFDPVRQRLRSAKSRIRKMGADYLSYSLIDAIVDSYFIILEKVGESMEELEEAVVSEPGEETIRELHQFKREMIFLRKSVWPLREVIGRMQRGESPFIRESMHIYLRDVYDHTIRIIETIETYRDILSGMLDIYLSSVSNKTNSVMKVLTIIATIFMPLTFLAGLYGMNFKYMPELDLHWTYPALLIVMAVIAISMLVFFRVKKWL